MRGENRELFWPPQQLSNDVSVSCCVSHYMQGSRVRMSKQCDSAAGTTRHVNHWFSISVCKVAFEPQAVACLWKVFLTAVVVFSCQHVDSVSSDGYHRWCPSLSCADPPNFTPHEVSSVRSGDVGRAAIQKNKGQREVLADCLRGVCLDWWRPHLLAWHVFSRQDMSCIKKWFMHGRGGMDQSYLSLPWKTLSSKVLSD